MIPMPSMEVILDPTTSHKTISIEITDDSHVEGDESFVLKLNFTSGETHRLNLTRPSTTVKIFDNDGKSWMIISSCDIIILNNTGKL